MAATPPLQLMSEARTPPTPLHGSVYHDEPSPSRYHTRSSTKKETNGIQRSPAQPKPGMRSSRTPKSPRSTSLGSAGALHSPKATPKPRPTRRVQIISPSSPDTDSSAPPPSKSLQPPQPSYLSATTIMSEGMLPTPVKTPQKKQVDKSKLTARALFQEQTQSQQMAPSPRKSLKNRRYNGFSLESFSAANANSEDNIQIFTDSCDKVPEVDASEDNPFVEQRRSQRNASAQKVVGTSKRRKVSASKKIDPQVQEAIDKDEGMVYVFRGKKVYRRFDDQDEEEEEIDPDDVGLLEHSPNGGTAVKPFRTLTRKSIKPTRLFETEEQKKARLSATDEEAETEIEDSSGDEAVSGALVIDEDSPPSRATEKSRVHNSGKSHVSSNGGKNGSPFDTWPRIKAGGRPSSTTPGARTRKRTAAEANE